MGAHALDRARVPELLVAHAGGRRRGSGYRVTADAGPFVLDLLPDPAERPGAGRERRCSRPDDRCSRPDDPRSRQEDRCSRQEDRCSLWRIVYATIIESRYARTSTIMSPSNRHTQQ
ncbi:hypothetical protein Sm713_31120 [Streptomyces sp. TS71-3]|nr:hypothetical protein Sm713_31120 [Streptomyces sp. TS71-3]